MATLVPITRASSKMLMPPASAGRQVHYLWPEPGLNAWQTADRARAWASRLRLAEPLRAAGVKVRQAA